MTDTSAAPARNPSLPALGFLLALLALAGLALGTLRSRPAILTGLPPGPRAERIRDSLANRLPVDTGGLRLEAALFGDDDSRPPPTAAAIATVLTAIAEQPREPRLHAAQGLVELSAGRYASAQRSYRRALDLAPGYGEARLGLGVTLALEADQEPDEGRARGLRLKAISQFAAVPGADPCREAALYDRVVLLLRAGRKEEARRWAREYLERDPGSPWSLVLQREIEGP